MDILTSSTMKYNIKHKMDLIRTYMKRITRHDSKSCDNVNVKVVITKSSHKDTVMS
jgi:hypothetical protein